MTRTLTTKLLLLFSITLGYWHASAQGWEKKYSPDAVMGIDIICPTPGGNYLVTGWDVGGTNTFQRIMKIAANGNVIWKSDIDSLYNPGSATITQDGGLVMMAGGVANNGNITSRGNVVRVDSNGQKLWLQTLRPPHTKADGSGNMDIDTTNNGGFAAVFSVYDSIAVNNVLYIDRLDGDGNIIWQKTYYTSGDTPTVGYAICNSGDGGFIVTAGANPQAGLYLFKVDSAGTFLWQYPATPSQGWLSATVAHDGNIFLLSTAFGGGDNAISKINQQGQLLWRQPYTLPDSTGWGWYGRLQERSNNRLVILATGYDTVNIPGVPYNTRANAFAFTIADTLGHLLFYKEVPTVNLGSNIATYQTSIKATVTSHEGGLIFGGWLQYDPQNYSGYLIKTDSNGAVYPSALSGYAYDDINNNCSKDPGEIFMAPVNLTFTSANDTFTVITSDSGYYSLGLNAGNYSVTVSPPSPYWQASDCNTTSVNLASGADTSITFALTPIISSPYILINGYLGPELSWCQPTAYTAEYCNYGTAPFTGSIVITVDTMLRVDSASIPWTSQSGNQYTFTADTLGIMQCATIKIYCTVDCYASLIGRTASIISQAFQDTIITSSPIWDHARVDMAVHYNPATDTITFTLTNNGTGNMGSPEDLIVIEDNVILMHITQQLVSGAQFTLPVKANGSTWRATMPQTPGNPYSIFTTAAIEAAGTNALGGFSTGYITQFPYNGYTSYQYNTCAEIKSSYDPNQKSVTPKGEGPDALIDTTTTLEYAIDFQNTGNASAYTVTVIDTLPPYLNPATIRLEVSSSPCRMQLSGKNIVTFTFNNINLPDSSVSRMGSTGFVKFGISQKSNNADGTVIHNKAGIYFDYNPVVTTNTATVRIGQLTLTGVQSLYDRKELLINAYPNPFNNYTVIKVDGEIFNNLQLNVYDLSGKLVKQQRTQSTNQFILYRSDLESGNYIFEITGDGKPVGKGKIVAQ